MHMDISSEDLEAFNQLPYMSKDGYVIAPNALLRGALFAGASAANRKALRRERIETLAGYDIRYTGMRLDQGDLDCWMAVIEASKTAPHHADGRFMVHGAAILRLMRLQDTGKNYAMLEGRLSKLKSGSIDIRINDEWRYEGSLIDEIARNESKRLLIIKLNTNMLRLFGHGWTGMELGHRAAMGRNQLARWLYAFASTHTTMHPISTPKIRELCASEIADIYRFRQQLKKAVQLVNEVTGMGIIYDPQKDAIYTHKRQKSCHNPVATVATT